ncbi:hypothetical protein IW261DRAFT_1606246 [Armillaria novae-zelandiae]|uniref:F-box domain-containing protein n=1 Tax=Armillaria novae-zelandiae TaxID=153914 RepID=A0AA39PEF7_9AGAR|nr:hypothetical protein IW261DRAFT_1606246 [Armillaria novae-zelandiae]
MMSSLTCHHCRSVNFLPLKPPLKNMQRSDSLVSKILRGHRGLLDSDHVLLTAEIVDLEQQLEEIQSCRCAVLKALKFRKSIYAPIRRLPRDILIEIFHFVCDYWWQYWTHSFSRPLDSLYISGPLWVLGRVCGVWRDTLHSSPASWARKLVVQQPFSKYAPEILQTYLEHTGKHPLNVKLVFCIKDDDDGDILSLLVQSCQRWKNLDITATKRHMRYLESDSQFSALQTLGMHIFGDYNCFRMCLNAPRLWSASLHATDGIHQIKLLPGITQFLGSITCPEDLRFLSQLPNLRRCRPTLVNLAVKEAPVVTMSHLTHLYANVDALDVLSTPLLDSLAVRLWAQGTLQGPRSYSPQESLTRFLHRSKCHLESLYVREEMFTLDTPTRIFALEACSTISRLTLELQPKRETFGLVEALTFPSVLPNLHHLVLVVSLPSRDEWTTVLRMVRSRRDAGMLKLVEIQSVFRVSELGSYVADDMRALTRDDFEMRVVRPPRRDHLSLDHLF